MAINKEDDYYTSVKKQSEEATDSNKKVVVKRKVVNKRIIKKKEPILKNKSKASIKVKKKMKTADTKSTRLNKSNADVLLDKKSDTKTPTKKTTQTKKDSVAKTKTSPNKNTNTKSYKKRTVRKKIIPLDKSTIQPAWTWAKKKAKIERESRPKNRSNYSNNKFKKKDGNEVLSSRNSNWSRKPTRTKTFTNNKSKYRGYKKAFKKPEEDKGFTRSKQMQQEKKEKSLKEIEQILVNKKWQTVEIWEFISVKEYSDKIGIPLSKVIAECMKNWMLVNLNSPIDFDTAYLIWEAFDIIITREESKNVSTEAVIAWDLESLIWKEDEDKSIKRPPVISIMGHVDHWKTSILDYIRKSKVAAWEAWWITQSIWAYSVDNKWEIITFLDTPWHEAFTIMRSRWAKLTDIAIIVVAADEWIKPQTIESINHAKAADIPIIVAINKMDKEWANPDLIKSQMAEHDVHCEDWGGEVPMIPVSAHTWEWIDDLLDIIVILSDMQELKANPERQGIATVIESHLDSSRWVLTTVLVNTWTLSKWDNIVCWWQAVKVRALKDFKWKSIKHSLPSCPALIMWLKEVVNWWDIVQVVKSPEVAKERARDYMTAENASSLNKFEGASLELLMSRIHAWSLKKLNIVLKTDTNWSLEAMKESLWKLSNEETRVNFIHAAVWDISESDVVLAWTSQALLISYNVRVWQWASDTLNNSKIEFINEKVIYHILEKVEKIITWMADIKYDEINLWEAKIWKVFYTWNKFYILWLIWIEWKAKSWVIAKIIRKDKKVWTGKITSLKTWIEEIKEITFPSECGIRYEWSWIPEEWDIVNFREIVKRK